MSYSSEDDSDCSSDFEVATCGGGSREMPDASDGMFGPSCDLSSLAAAAAAPCAASAAAAAAAADVAYISPYADMEMLLASCLLTREYDAVMVRSALSAADAAVVSAPAAAAAAAFAPKQVASKVYITQEQDEDDDDDGDCVDSVIKAAALAAAVSKRVVVVVDAESVPQSKKRARSGDGAPEEKLTKNVIADILLTCDIVRASSYALSKRNGVRAAWASVRHDFRVANNPDPKAKKNKNGGGVVTLRGKSTLEYAYYLLIASSTKEQVGNVLRLIKVLLLECQALPPPFENEVAFASFLQFVTETAIRAARSAPEIADASPTAHWRRRFQFVSALIVHGQWLNTAEGVVAAIMAFVEHGRFEMISAVVKIKDRMSLLPAKDCFNLLEFAFRSRRQLEVRALLSSNELSTQIASATMQTVEGRETLLHFDARFMDGEFTNRLLELNQNPLVADIHGCLALDRLVAEVGARSEQRMMAISLHEGAIKVARDALEIQAKHAAALSVDDDGAGAAGGSV